MEKIIMSQNKNLVDEYKEIGQNLRQYGNMRFAQLTLFLVASGYLFRIKYEAKLPLTNDQCVCTGVVGIILTLCFWLMEERAADNWFDCNQRAKVIESQIGCAQYTSRRTKKLFSAGNAVRVIFIVSFVFWFRSIAVI